MKALFICCILLLAVIISACEEHVEVERSKQLETLRTFSLSDKPELENLIPGVQSNSRMRVSGEEFLMANYGRLGLNEIVELKRDSFTSYTFKLQPYDTVPGKREYLILTNRGSGFVGYILQYERVEANSANYFERFTGYIRVLNLNREIEAENIFDNGTEVGIDSDRGRSAGIDTNCDCDYKYKVKDYNQYSGTGSGFGTADVELVGIECICDAGGGEEGTRGIGDPIEGGTGAENDGGGGIRDGDGSSDVIGIMDLGQCITGEWNNLGQCCEFGLGEDYQCMSQEEAEAELWEEKIELSNQFENNECAIKVFDLLKENDRAYSLVKSFFDDSAISGNLNIDLNPELLPNNPGRTIKQDNSIKIELNSNIFDSHSTLSISQALLHEFIHAHLFEAESIGDETFEELFNKYADSKYGTTQHNIMINEYIETMSSVLFEIDDKEFPLDYYKALSYRGLRNTDYYINNIKDTPDETIYESLQGQLLGNRPSCK